MKVEFVDIQHLAKNDQDLLKMRSGEYALIKAENNEIYYQLQNSTVAAQIHR